MLRNDDNDHNDLPGVPAPSGVRILVVEDDAPNRQLLHDILALRGHRVIEAANVEQASQALVSERIDLLLLDVNIPGGGAEAVIREVRRHFPSAGIPIVAVTSLAMPGDRERLLGSGFQGYLSKPIDTRTFAATVEQFLLHPLASAHVQRVD